MKQGSQRNNQENHPTSLQRTQPDAKTDSLTVPTTTATYRDERGTDGGRDDRPADLGGGAGGAR